VSFPLMLVPNATLHPQILVASPVLRITSQN
jgi:hypothetical protein